MDSKTNQRIGWICTIAVLFRLVTMAESNLLTLVKTASRLTSYDASADWVSSLRVAAQGCRLQPRPTYPPMPPVNGTSPIRATVADVIQNAWLMAPILYMHPDEWSFLTDPASWLANKPFYDTATLEVQSIGLPDNITFSTVQPNIAVWGLDQFTSAVFPDGFSSSEASISTATLKQRIRGDGYNAQNRSQAKVWYTAFDAVDAYQFNNSATPPYKRGEALIIKYHYYYPFNGCSNQVLALALEGKYQGIEYFMCPTGVHEGDWEHLSLLVSVADWDPNNPSKSIKRVQYSAHSWNSQYDCDKGECSYDTDDVSADLLMNVDGVYIGDRTAKGGAVFMPTPTNTLFLPLLTNMTVEERQGKYSWATFAGSMGGYLIQTGTNISITCLTNDLTQEVTCPAGNPATSYIDYFVGIKATLFSLDSLPWVTTATPGFNLNPITGPLMRDFTYQWERQGVAPIYSDPILSTSITCPFTGDPSSTNISSYTFQEPNLRGFIGILAVTLVGCAVAFMVFLFFPQVQGTFQITKQIVENITTVEYKEDMRSTISHGKAGSHLATHVHNSNIALKTAVAVAEGTADVDTLGGGSVNQIPIPRNPCWLECCAPFLGCCRPKAAGVKVANGLGRDMEGSSKQLTGERHPQIVREFELWRPLSFILLGITSYVIGLILTVKGVRDVFSALEEIYYLSIYDSLRKVLEFILTMFGIAQLVLIVLVIFVRSEQLLLCCGCKLWNPCGCGNFSNNLGIILHNILAGIHVLALYAAMLLFSFGFFMTLLWMLFQLACNRVLAGIFEAIPLAQACIDFNPIGIPVNFCGAQLVTVCNIWNGLHTDLIAYGCLLIVLSHAMSLVQTVHQSANLRTNSMLSYWMWNIRDWISKARTTRQMSVAPHSVVEVLPLERSTGPSHLQSPPEPVEMKV